MKKIFALMLLLTVAGGFAGNTGADRGAAGQAGLAERLGAHWARVSDRAQIELIVDELRAAARGETHIRIAQKQLSGSVGAPGHGVAIQGARSTDAPVIEVNGATARVRFTTGGELELQKVDHRWRVISGQGAVHDGRTGPDHTSVLKTPTGVSIGETFIATPVSRDHDIERLSRGVTKAKLNRALFGTPEKTASYYTARYMQSAPYVSATYLQFVTDPEWNRVLYGNMDRWIKSHNDVQGPSAIAVDADGRLFIGETGTQRVSVLRIAGEGQEAHLQPLFQVSNITNPTDIALSDNGTPLDTRDDILFVADASQNKILKYALLPAGATLVAAFDGFDSPTSIQVGRWNGANNGLLYIVDKLAKRVRVYDEMGTQLSLLRELNGTYDQYFSSVRTDHFGNIYLVDNVHSQVFKCTSSLEILDAHGGPDAFASLATVEIPFGKITIEGQGTYWAGFDQMLALERWTDNTGAQRRTLGLAMKNIVFTADADVATIENAFTLTDFADVQINIYDNTSHLVRRLDASWMVSGRKLINWDRRNDAGQQVPPGTYQYEIDARSAYRDNPTVSKTKFSLPLYYWENSGSANELEDIHLLQGKSVRWGTGPSQTANEHASSVQYRFTGLHPESEYMVSAEYVAPDGIRRLQDMTVNGVRIHDPINVTTVPTRVAYIKLPKELSTTGEIIVSINKWAEGSAIVSQLWLKESGIGFSAEQIHEAIPTAYALAHNYPNPFNPSTIIRYAIPVDGDVTLKVFDMTGREVATLVNEHKRAGSYEVRFSANGGSASGGDAGIAVGGRTLASGVYFYRLQAGSFSAARKMVLVK